MDKEQKAAFDLLDKAGLFYGGDCPQELNMNDTWGWATAWGVEVADNELPELKHLFWCYGWCGVLYWASQKYDGMRSEFYHYNRMLEFVENEERIRKMFPKESDLAYHNEAYKIKGKRK